MLIELQEQEQEVLRSILTSSLADLREEIRRTENYQFKARLTKRKAILEMLLEMVDAPRKASHSNELVN